MNQLDVDVNVKMYDEIHCGLLIYVDIQPHACNFLLYFCGWSTINVQAQCNMLYIN